MAGSANTATDTVWKLPSSFSIPRPPTVESSSTPSTTARHGTEPRRTFITPNAQSFQKTFNPNNVLPKPHFLDSPAGRIALYTPTDIAASLHFPSPNALNNLSLSASTPNSTTITGTNTQPHRILLLHGLATPSLGLLPLAHSLLSHCSQPLEIAFFDLPGHGLSSTPSQPHTLTLLHAQIHLVLSYLSWTSRTNPISLVGYSFGGSLAVSFTTTHPWLIRSVALLAPVGVMNLNLGEMSVDLQQRIYNPSATDDTEEETRREVLAWMEGGDDGKGKGHLPAVPEDAAERIARGEVVAEALRRWEWEEHPGYQWSVLSLFREGGVVGCEEGYQVLAALGRGESIGGGGDGNGVGEEQKRRDGRRVRTKIVLGELDPCCEEKKVRELGLQDVEVLKGEEHAFPRTRVEDVAQVLVRFWDER